MIVEFRRICNRDSMRTGISLQINTQIVFIERPNNNKKNISKCFLYLPTHLIHENGVEFYQWIVIWTTRKVKTFQVTKWSDFKSFFGKTFVSTIHTQLWNETQLSLGNHFGVPNKSISCTEQVTKTRLIIDNANFGSS